MNLQKDNKTGIEHRAEITKLCCPSFKVNLYEFNQSCEYQGRLALDCCISHQQKQMMQRKIQNLLFLFNCNWAPHESLPQDELLHREKQLLSVIPHTYIPEGQLLRCVSNKFFSRISLQITKKELMLISVVGGHLPWRFEARRTN